MPDRINIPTTIGQSVAQHAVNVLNEALAADPATISALVDFRIPCNQKLADHPTIQVAGPEDKPRVGLLGIINGMVSRQTGHKVAAAFDENNKLLGFQISS